ncbi:MAG: carbohydrate ABC transporter permease [Spirochaetaceae bacterium]|jgi:multiple sugar transport system permease protein|nr:carbohydrate ABC transporter permease [Spirochaetaceae bacterium]
MITKGKLQKIVSMTQYYVVAVILALIVGVPFFWMVITSLKSRGAMMSIPVEWIPKEPSLDSYRSLFGIPNFGLSILNSFYLAVVCTVVNLLCAAMAAFALTKIPFKGQKVVFSLYLTAMMLPAQVTFIPLFIIMAKLGLTNSLNALVLFQLFNATSIFMLRQHMKTIDKSYMEAAVIDGAGLWYIFWRIILPLCSTALATLSILSFMNSWNDYLLPLVLLSDRAKATLPIILSSMSGQYRTQYNIMMAGALLSIIPILIVYLCVQKHFKSGLTAGGVKG